MKGMERLQTRHPWLHRYLTDLPFRARCGIRLSFGITALYSLYKAALGLWYRSVWFGAMAGYYLVLGVLRFLLLRQLRSGERNPLRGWRQFRRCGGLLLVLTAALGTVSFFAVTGGEAIRYPGHLIYGAAAFTFYNLTMAVVNIQRYRKLKNPTYNAAKLLCLATGLVSLFFLQLSLLAAFGAGEGWQLPLNIATGTVVLLLVLGMAVYMMREGTLRLREQKRNA